MRAPPGRRGAPKTRHFIFSPTIPPAGASRIGDFSALLALLDPDVVLRADAVALAMSASAGVGAPSLAPETRGAAAVAETFKGRAAAARIALVDGDIGAVYAPGAIPPVVFRFTIENGCIAAIDLVATRTRSRRWTSRLSVRVPPNLCYIAVMSLLDRITSEPDKFGGRPCIRGLRIRVVDVLDLLAAGLTHEQILEELPDLEADDIKAAIAFASRRVDHPVISA